jgi:hypothetical protein
LSFPWPDLKRSKSDANDVAAIREAVTRPEARLFGHELIF